MPAPQQGKKDPYTFIGVTIILLKYLTHTRISLDIGKLQRRFSKIRAGICQGEKQTKVAVFPAANVCQLETQERTEIPTVEITKRFQKRWKGTSSDWTKLVLAQEDEFWQDNLITGTCKRFVNYVLGETKKRFSLSYGYPMHSVRTRRN